MKPDPAAVIFDVDGVLLELTHDEEEVFFTALSRFVPTQHLSRDWNSYRIRNDDDIIAEILERHRKPPAMKEDVVSHYIRLLQSALATDLRSALIRGADALVAALAPWARLGIATANLKAAAQARLMQVNLWEPVAALAEGADGGGHKHQVLARLLARIDLPRERIVYIGDNLNDVEAGLKNGVHFIGFSTDPQRRASLARHGAPHISGNHPETIRIVQALMA